MDIEKYSGLLSTDEIIHYEYDKDGDFLEIFFQYGEATAAIELAHNMVLRFDWDTCAPLSLGIICFSKLLESIADGEKYLMLLEDEWPDEAIDKVWQMLEQSPLKDLLKLKRPKVEFIDEEFVGMWRNREGMKDSSDWVRQVRRNEWRVRA